MPVRSSDPDWLKRAYRDLGLKETPGAPSTKRILEMYRLAGHPYVKDDGVAWCSAAANAWMAEAGHKGTGSLAARSWLKWGKKLDHDKPLPRGAVVIFTRGNSTWQGHVAFVVEDKGERLIKVLGGNQSDAVTEAMYRRGALLGARWPNEVATGAPPPARPPAPVAPSPSPRPEPAPIPDPPDVEPVEPEPAKPPKTGISEGSATGVAVGTGGTLWAIWEAIERAPESLLNAFVAAIEKPKFWVFLGVAAAAGGVFWWRRRAKKRAAE